MAHHLPSILRRAKAAPATDSQRAVAAAFARAGVVAFWAVAACSPAAAQAGRTAVDPSVRLAEAQRDATVRQSLLVQGRRAATAVCANCHGPSGQSSKPGVPNLAGQNAAYVLEQARRFADGRRRNEFMEGMIRAMSTDEKVGVALYYAAQTVSPAVPADAAAAARGKAYYERVCFRCHGADGHGSDQLPRIASQGMDYLQATLRAYRSGTGPRQDPLMTSNAKLMSDAEIDAVAAFVSGMP